ncbi:hypothetical protein ACFQE1_06525 [Halobium palmae]|uniref:Uncharacterized protein n=1 Tax=Halobium palmae TaxID=1776492 RepID=A0ABD5RX75_9EURY
MVEGSQSPVDRPRDDEERGESHLADVEDGAGCTEIWEHLSDRREASGDDVAADD